jgi:hypothetical protein
MVIAFNRRMNSAPRSRVFSSPKPFSFALRLMEQSLRVKVGFDALLSELELAGVLGGEAIGRIKDSISHPDASGAREFDRVYGIEAYFK